MGVQSDGGADDRHGVGLRLGQRLGGVEHHGEQVHQERPAHGRPHVRLPLELSPPHRLSAFARDSAGTGCSPPELRAVPCKRS
eukprot:SAG31_NODE_5002_length_2807_cov_33.203471_4_plen_83_part_00